MAIAVLALVVSVMSLPIGYFGLKLAQGQDDSGPLTLHPLTVACVAPASDSGFALAFGLAVTNPHGQSSVLVFRNASFTVDSGFDLPNFSTAVGQLDSLSATDLQRFVSQLERPSGINYGSDPFGAVEVGPREARLWNPVFYVPRPPGGQLNTRNELGIPVQLEFTDVNDLSQTDKSLTLRVDFEFLNFALSEGTPICRENTISQWPESVPTLAGER